MTEAEMPVLIPIPVFKRGERRRWKLKKDWSFAIDPGGGEIIIPAHFIFDGASIPWGFRNTLSPTGYLFLAGLVHDFIYKYAFVWMKYGVNISREDQSRESADKLFSDVAMRIFMGEKVWTKIALKALRWWGFISWKRHRKADVPCTIFPAGYFPAPLNLMDID